MNILRASGTLAALTVLLAAAPSPGPVVHIADFAFHPQTITVRAGTDVTFVNDDQEPHTVTAVDKSFDSQGLDLHQSWHHTFAKPGSYAYFCEVHPMMKGTVVVLPASGAP